MEIIELIDKKEDKKLYQWDLDRKIKITPPEGIEVDEAHFAHPRDKEALVVRTRGEGKDLVADIPNILLQSSQYIRVWLVSGDQTICAKVLAVIERAKPADYIYTETEILRYENLEKRIAALEKAASEGGAEEVPKSVWVGKRFVAFGTSITRKCDDYAGGYLEVIRKRLGVSSYTNKGISGASMISNGINGVTDNILDAILNADLTDYDLIILECTSNDFKLNVPIGTVGIMGDTGFDSTTFCGAVRTAIEHILVTYPMKHILLIASPQRYDGQYDVNYENPAECKQIDYVNAIISIGELYGITTVDLYRKSGVNALTVSNYTYDGLHPNAMGYMMLGNLIASEIGNMACAFDGNNAVWKDTVLTLNGQMYDIAVSAGYEYKMVMNLNGTLYLYYDTEPFMIHKEGYRECFTPDCYRASNANRVFGSVSTVTNGTHQVDLGDGYWKMNKDRTLDQYVVSNHDICYWGTEEIAVPATK